MKKSLIKLVIVAVLIVVAAFLALNGLHIPGKSTYLKPVGEAISLGLDLRGGVSTEYIATDTSMENYESLLEGTVSALRTRLTNAGFTEANVAAVGESARSSILPPAPPEATRKSIEVMSLKDIS
jgi:preprotein translocase subunit SecD